MGLGLKASNWPAVDAVRSIKHQSKAVVDHPEHQIRGGVTYQYLVSSPCVLVLSMWPLNYLVFTFSFF